MKSGEFVGLAEPAEVVGLDGITALAELVESVDIECAELAEAPERAEPSKLAESSDRIGAVKPSRFTGSVGVEESTVTLEFQGQAELADSVEPLDGDSTPAPSDSLALLGVP